MMATTITTPDADQRAFNPDGLDLTRYPAIQHYLEISIHASKSTSAKTGAKLSAMGIHYESWLLPFYVAQRNKKRDPCMRLNHKLGFGCNRDTEKAQWSCTYDHCCVLCGQLGHGYNEWDMRLFQPNSHLEEARTRKCSFYESLEKDVAKINEIVAKHWSLDDLVDLVKHARAECQRHKCTLIQWIHKTHIDIPEIGDVPVPAPVYGQSQRHPMDNVHHVPVSAPTPTHIPTTSRPTLSMMSVFLAQQQAQRQLVENLGNDFDDHVNTPYYDIKVLGHSFAPNPSTTRAEGNDGTFEHVGGITLHDALLRMDALEREVRSMREILSKFVV